jgi:uncharacterized protein (TIGR02453 family)
MPLKENPMSDFEGFPKQSVTFLTDLKKNNNKDWFHREKQGYETYIMEPARTFVVEMGRRLRSIAPHINAIPKVNQSLFRIHRDTRFSHDKTPYKTNLGVWFWEGKRKRMECSGFYFHYGDGKLMLGVGMHVLSSGLLKRYREAVADEKLGPELVRSANKIAKQGYAIGVKHYKRVPRGYDSQHPRVEFLLHKGLTASVEEKLPEVFFSPKIVDYTFSHFKRMEPIHQWLRKVMD